MRTVLLIAGVIVGFVSAAHAAPPLPTTEFCLAQSALVAKHIGPLVKPPSTTSSKTLRAVGAVVVTLKLGEQPCFIFDGETKLGSGVAPDANTVFELASITKVFTTAILAMHEWQQGLNVDAPVALYLPTGYSLQPEEQDVTFQQLATFTGGFYWDDPKDFTNGERYSQSDFMTDVNHLVPKKKDAASKGQDLPTLDHYSNGSTGFLGQILMDMDSTKVQPYPFHATGFSNWIAANVTGPLRMPNTAVRPGGVWAKGYKYVGGLYQLEDRFPWEPWGAAGALRSTGADMLNFLAANICAHHVGDPACAGLPQNVLTALATAHRPNAYTPAGTMPDPTIYLSDTSRVEQAWAWAYRPPPVPNPDSLTSIIYKDGGHPGFSTLISFSPDKSYGSVILMNTGGIGLKSAADKIINQTP